MPTSGVKAEESGMDAWKRRKSSVLMFPDVDAADPHGGESKGMRSAKSAAAAGAGSGDAATAAAAATRKGDAEEGVSRVFRSQASKVSKANSSGGGTARRGMSKTRNGTFLPDSSLSTCACPYVCVPSVV